MNRRSYIQETTILQRKYEAKYLPRVQRVLNAKVSQVASIVSEQGVQAAIGYVHLQVHSKGLPTVIEGLYNEVGLRFARRTWIGLQDQRRQAKDNGISYQEKGFGFNQSWVDFIKNYLFRFLLEKITFAVAETTRNILLTVLNNAIEGGWGIDKTVRELEDLPLSRAQAARIVRTEITRATNTGIAAAGSTFDFEQTKEWIAAHDRRTRGTRPKDHASHVGLDGQTIEEDEVFVDPRNGDELRFPGDPQAKAESTVNCRCVIALVAKVDERGRLIPKVNKAVKSKPNNIQVKEDNMDIDAIRELETKILALKTRMLNTRIPEMQFVVKTAELRMPEVDMDGMETELDKLFKESAGVSREMVKSSANMMQEVIQVKDMVANLPFAEIDEMLNKLMQKDFNPTIEVNPTELISLISDRYQQIISAINEINLRIAKRPTSYQFVFERDARGFIKSPITVKVKN